MNAAHLHLVVNHLPVVLPLVGAPVLVIGLAKKSSEIAKVGYWILIFAALVAVPAYFTGAPAEQVILNYPSINREAIHAHQQAALWGLATALAAGALSALILWLEHRKRKIPRWTQTVMAVISVSCFAVMARVALLGGQIRHEEIQTFDTIGP